MAEAAAPIPSLSEKPGIIGRFLALLAPEKRAITHIYVYAIFAGLLTLSLPLGVQSVIGFVSSGQISTSVIVLLVFITLGTLLTGGLQIMQLALVEHLQERLFTRTAYDFALRITRVQPEALARQYPPELMNRFFDVLTLQKGLSKLLIEFSAALLQMLFGLILLSFYHPYFILFGLLLIAILVVILRLTGEKGMKTSLYESKYKYQLVSWLEEMARTFYSFKLAGSSHGGIRRTDELTGQYLHARKSHFRVLLTQYYSFVGFKTLITGTLLIMGCLLLISKEINLGQFVASEIIVITLINAIEKVLIKLDVVYDMLTSTEKLGVVTDLPMEEPAGILFQQLPQTDQLTIRLSDIRYRFPGESVYALKGINVTISPGEKLCLAGPGGSGKTTLLRILMGLFPSYEGVITYNTVSLRDLNKPSLLNHIGEDTLPQALFEGTILENLSLGADTPPVEAVLWALECVGATEFVQTLPKGIHTVVVGGGQQLPASIVRKLTLARCLAKKPRVLVLDEFLLGLESRERAAILHRIKETSPKSTIVIASNDPLVMQECDRTLWLKEGKIAWEGKYEEMQETAGGFE